MTAATNILELIGHTPLVRVNHLDTGPCTLFLKLESQNPGGSIKDRIALSMIAVAEESGKLKPGGVLVEATAGNTGLGLALVASQKGYRLILVIPDKMSQEKIFHLKAMGAEVVMTRSDVGKGHPEYYHDMAERITRETPGAFYVNQFENPANPEAHFRSTAPEIWQQMEHKLDAVVCGVGSGGTLSGLGRYFKQQAPHVEMVLADPEGSVLAPFVNTGKMIEPGSWLVEGIGEDFIPKNCDLSLVKHAYTITDAESIGASRELLRREGIICGSSSGTLLAGALRYCRAQKNAKRVVSFVCDSGNKYLSKIYNEYWLDDHGIVQREQHGDLRDLIARPQTKHGTITAGPDDTLAAAYRKMRMHDISQLPVLEGEKIVGLLHETDMLRALAENTGGFNTTIRSAMRTDLVTIQVGDSIQSLLPIYQRGMIAIVVDGTRFLGLVTPIDMLQFLRKREARA